MDDLFAPPSAAWQRVSPTLATLRRWLLLAWCGGISLVAILAWLIFSWPFWISGIAIGLSVIALGWGLWLIPRNYRAWGYAERDADLLVTHGVLMRRLTVVPYGRMQLVDVHSGPLERRFGLASVQLHTASPASDARIPGLPADEAARLRDRLSALGEVQAAGL